MATVIRNLELTVEVLRIELFEACTVVVHAEEVQVVWILALVVASSGEVDNTLSIVYTKHVRYVPLALSNLVDERTISRIAVEVCPACALRPLDNLLVAIDECRHLPLDRCIHLLNDNILCCSCSNIYYAEVCALDVAALTNDVELIVVTLPYHAHGALVHI